ncbi:kinesin-like protein KIN-10C isoform X2 [Telopea speciosissima]|uniref:kinesin-like protein KIN-10C isoform X2 n=1 Tax=Telopea speciosissima TaxID=54955 RepID=UPI001CC6E3BD|nr:kinesin-like protein KIN-10C isoform X2 [Telopea speciosissima]
MASSTPDSVRSKVISASNSDQRVRIVAKIRPFTNLEIESSNGSPNPCIFVQTPEPESSERVTISFHDQLTSKKESFKLDYCYDQDEDVGQIFSREVRQLVSGIFRGLNASVLVYGAKGSGKTYTIQGSNEKPGLAPMALAEILSACEETGSSVTISCYEVCLDHVYDLLEPKEVSVFEDTGGRIVLKGLSQVPVKSITDFYKLNFHGCTSRKPAQKPTTDVPYRSHKGLIISLFSNDKNPNACRLGKINFVDLAAHESTRMDKSLYALQNVVYALNVNERVPYRESKLTRMLQDSFGEPKQNLIVTCLNPSFCQDTINTISWASRSCLVLNRICPDSTKKTKTVGKSMVFCTPKSGKTQNLTASTKKQNSSKLEYFGKNTNGVSSATKGRKLFDRANTTFNSEQMVSSTSEAGKTQNFTASTKKQNSSKLEFFRKNANGVSSATKGRKLFDRANPTINSEQEISLSSVPHAIEPFRVNESVRSLPEVSIGTECDTNALIVAEEKGNDIIDEVSSSICVTKDKENISTNEDGSPPLSARIRELSNSLKALSSSTPLNIKMPLEGWNSRNNEVGKNVVEPKTPKIEQSARSNDNLEIAIIGTPREKFNLCSSGLKNSLIQEFLKFLNTANKEELKGMKGIGEKRANYILELRNESPEPFKDLSDLKDIGLAMKQINEMMRKIAGGLFN